MQVKDVMTSGAIVIAASASLGEAIDLMLRSRISALPVVDEANSLVGMLSEGDLLRRDEIGTERQRPRWLELFLGSGRLADAYVHTHGRRVDEVMSRGVVSIEATAPLQDAVDLMTRRKVKRLPVLAGGRLVGVLARADLLKALRAKLVPSETPLKDPEIHAAIMAEIKRQTWTPLASIEVEVHNGEVEFHGCVSDDRVRGALRVIAENVAGVRKIHDHIAWVEPNSGLLMPSDEDLEGERHAP